MRRVKEEPVGLDIGYDSTDPGKVRKKNDENRMELMAAGDLPALQPLGSLEGDCSGYPGLIYLKTR
jgi:hypothetical protein